MNIFKHNKKLITLQKYKPVFITVDGVEHIGPEYCWIIADRLKRGVPEYIMIDIKSDDYIKDTNDIMYMLSNVISIKWELVDSILIEDNFDPYQVCVHNNIKGV